MMFHKKRAGAPIALVAAMLLAGCVSIGSKPPQQLLTLDAAHKVPTGAQSNAGGGRSIIITDPEAARIIDTVRVPVQTSPTSVAYVTKVQWAETPRHLFRRLLAETVSATTDRIVLDPGQFSGDGGQRLSGELIAFGIDGASNSAVVTFDAALMTPAGVAIARQRFTASAPVGGKIDANSVGAPLNGAANKVATDVAAWVAAQKD